MRAGWALRGLSQWREAARTLAEEGFSRSSPLPFLSASELDEIGGYPVLMPPSNRLLHGGQGYQGLAFLSGLAKRLGAETIFEIGTFTGVTAWTLANNTRAVVHTLDLPGDDRARLPIEDRDRLFRAPGERLFEVLGGNVHQHWGDSATFDFSPFYGRCDLVYVDGAHSYDYVRSDTEQALKMRTPGGAIVWDDYSRRWPGVTRFLNEFDRKIYRVPGLALVVLLDAG